MKFLRYLFLLILLLYVYTYCGAQPFSDALKGSSGAQILRIEGTARNLSLGGSACAYSPGAESVFINPAGMSLSGGGKASATHSMWFEDVYYSQVSAAFSYKSSVLGFYTGYLGMNDIPMYTSEGYSRDSFYSPYSLSSGFYISRPAGSDGFYGVGIKGLYHNIDGDSALSTALDVGYLRNDGNIFSAFSVRNAGFPMKFANQSSPLPLEINAGLAWHAPFDELVVFGSLFFPYYDNPSVNAGVQYTYPVSDVEFNIRGAYNTSRAQKQGVLSAFSAGCGIKLGSFNIDYSWLPRAGRESSHRLSLSLRAAEPEAKKAEEYIFKEKEKNMYIEYFLIKGKSYYERGEFEEAEEYFKRVLKFAPQNEDARIYLESLSRKRGHE
ncbi:MAG: tetratricopeptide repeat protein [Elusimicrobiota bacterium]